MSKKQKITTAIIAVIIVVLVAFFMIGNNKKSDSASSSDSSSTSVTKTSTGVKNHITVEDTQKDPSLSATVMALYGADNLKNDDWKSLKASRLEGKLVLHVINNGEYYRFTTDKITDINKAPYYKLKGDNHDTVEYYANVSGDDKLLKTISLQDVIDYINHHYSSDKIDSYK